MEELEKSYLDYESEDYGFTKRTIELRKREGLNQSEFAEKIGVTLVTVSDIEREKARLSLRLAIVISKVFNVSLDWLYGLSNDTNDDASNIIDDLRNVFKFDLERSCVSIDKDLADFLIKLTDAYKTKAEKDIPDEGFKYWIDGIKKEYNDKVKENKNNPKLYIRYYLQELI